MSRVDAPSIFAQMMDGHALGDWSVNQLVTKTMRFDEFAVNSEVPVSSGNSASPVPARIGFGHEFPKATLYIKSRDSRRIAIETNPPVVHCTQAPTSHVFSTSSDRTDFNRCFHNAKYITLNRHMQITRAT